LHRQPQGGPAGKVKAVAGRAGEKQRSVVSGQKNHWVNPDTKLQSKDIEYSCHSERSAAE
jgi:hypothetical protein